MLKIDAHAHVLPPDWPNMQEQYGVAGFPYVERQGNRTLIYRDGQFFREIWPSAYDAELRIEQYAEFGVQVQVVSTVPVMFSYWAAAEPALAFAQFLNDHVASMIDAHPRHYAGLGTLPMQSPTHAIDELIRCSEIGLSGVQIGSHINDWNLDAPELFDVFAAAAEHDMAILVHPWDMMGQASMPKYWLPWLVSMPAEQSRAICCMIFGGIFERLPSLRVCFAHGGGSFPFTIGRIEHGFRMRPDLVATDNDRNPRDYLGTFYLDSAVHDVAALRYLIELMGVDSIMLGTDYPFPLGEQEPGTCIDALGLDEAGQARLFHGSALSWLGLDPARFS